MKIIRKPQVMRQISERLKRSGYSIGLVPTMGALHQGHASLIRRAVLENDKVVVSIFVNPTQFGPAEDFKHYPRQLKKDAALCRKERVDFIFYPAARDMYPQRFKTYVFVEGLSDLLCGKSRPGHFRGVTTVVNKFFNIIAPDAAYFGQKDAQQAIIIRRMVEDLNMPLKIKVMPIVRESSGLAMSSRNKYLDDKEKKSALVLYASIKKARELIKRGIRDSAKIIKAVRGLIAKIKPSKIDYVSVVDADNLEPVNKIRDKALLVLAVRIGKTRLIDNALLKA